MGIIWGSILAYFGKLWYIWARIFGRGIGRFYGLDYALRDRGWFDEYTGKPGTELFVARDNN